MIKARMDYYGTLRAKLEAAGDPEAAPKAFKAAKELKFDRNGQPKEIK